MGRFRPVMALRDFFVIATCYAEPAGGFGQERSSNRLAEPPFFCKLTAGTATPLLE